MKKQGLFFFFHILFNVYIQPLGYDRPTRLSIISVRGDFRPNTALSDMPDYAVHKWNHATSCAEKKV